jgi:hypothetical protein
MPSPSSVSTWLQRLQADDQAAARQPLACPLRWSAEDAVSLGEVGPVVAAAGLAGGAEWFAQTRAA